MPVTFTVPLQDQEIPEKSSTTLTCETSKPAVPVKWHKSGQELVTGLHYKLGQDGVSCSLDVLNATLDDTADYSCTIVSSMTKTVAKLLVKGESLGNLTS